VARSDAVVASTQAVSSGWRIARVACLAGHGLEALDHPRAVAELA
jgi:hypothetical protein